MGFKLCHEVQIFSVRKHLSQGFKGKIQSFSLYMIFMMITIFRLPQQIQYTLFHLLQIIERMTSAAFEHDNFVWLDFEAVHEILDKRIPGSSDAVVVFNNLLRWSLYQIDRTALDGVEVPLKN